MYFLYQFPKSTGQLRQIRLQKTNLVAHLRYRCRVLLKQLTYGNTLLIFVILYYNYMLIFYDFMYHVYNIKRALDLPPKQSLDDMFWEQVSYYATPVLHLHLILSLHFELYKLHSPDYKDELFLVLDELDKNTSRDIAVKQSIHNMSRIKFFLKLKYSTIKEALLKLPVSISLRRSSLFSQLSFLVKSFLRKKKWNSNTVTHKLLLLLVSFSIHEVMFLVNANLLYGFIFISCFCLLI